MAPTAVNENPDQYRLPTDVKPTHYDVVVKTDLEKLTFQGVVKARCVSVSTFCRATVKIPLDSFDVVKETSSITLNSATLDLGKV